MTSLVYHPNIYIRIRTIFAVTLDIRAHHKRGSRVFIILQWCLSDIVFWIVDIPIEDLVETWN
jgi:hypothetical protein